MAGYFTTFSWKYTNIHWALFIGALTYIHVFMCTYMYIHDLLLSVNWLFSMQKPPEAPGNPMPLNSAPINPLPIATKINQ